MLKKSVNLADRVLERVESILAGVATACVAAILIVTVAEMFLRGVFNSPIRGSLQVVAYLMVGATFLPLAYVRRRGDMISIRLLVDRLPDRARALQRRLVGTVELVVALSLFVSVVVTMLNYQEYGIRTAGAINIPVAPITAVMAVGLGLLVVELVLNQFRSESSGEAELGLKSEVLRGM